MPRPWEAENAKSGDTHTDGGAPQILHRHITCTLSIQNLYIKLTLVTQAPIVGCVTGSILNRSDAAVCVEKLYSFAQPPPTRSGAINQPTVCPFDSHMSKVAIKRTLSNSLPLRGGFRLYNWRGLRICKPPEPERPTRMGELRQRAPFDKASPVEMP